MIPCGTQARQLNIHHLQMIFPLRPPLIGGFPARFDCLPGIPRTMELWISNSHQSKRNISNIQKLYICLVSIPLRRKNINMSDLGSCFFFLIIIQKRETSIRWVGPVARPTPTLRLPGTVRQNQHGSSGQEQWNWLRGSSLLGPLGGRRCIQHGTRQFRPPKKMT